jgi:choline-sulfatase
MAGASRCASRIAVALAIGLGLAGGGCTSPAGAGVPPVPRYRNVIVVLIDTLRSDHLPSYGYRRNTAPTLARLAHQGIQLQGYPAASWTRPSVASLLTGLRPSRHGTVGRLDRLPAKLPYLPALLADAGFQTAAVISSPQLTEAFGFKRGFALFHVLESPPPTWRLGGRPKPGAREVVDDVLDVAPLLTSPYFLYVHFLDPHDPYVPRRAWDAERRGPRPYVQPRILQVRQALGHIPTAAQLSDMRDQYDGEIAEMDTEIARMMDGLAAAGALEDTLVIVTADHGEEFEEHGGLVHGYTLFEESLRVPFVLWAEHGLHPYASEAPLYQVDVVPTVLDALEVPAVPDLDGRSRWSEVVRGHPRADAPLFFHLDLDGNAALGIREGSMKLVLRSNPPDSTLFDLARDPGERVNLPADDPRRVDLARRLLERVMDEVAVRPRKEFARLTEDVMGRLEALGYVTRLAPGEKPPPRRADPHAAIDPSDPGVQLLSGFARPDPKGAWGGSHVRFALRLTPGARAVRLRGRAPSSTQCTVTIGGVTTGPRRVPQGPVDLTVPIPEAVRGERVVFVTIDVRPTSFVEGVAMPVGFHWSRFEVVGDAAPAAGPATAGR